MGRGGTDIGSVFFGRLNGLLVPPRDFGSQEPESVQTDEHADYDGGHHFDPVREEDREREKKRERGLESVMLLDLEDGTRAAAKAVEEWSGNVPVLQGRNASNREERIRTGSFGKSGKGATHAFGKKSGQEGEERRPALPKAIKSSARVASRQFFIPRFTLRRSFENADSPSDEPDRPALQLSRQDLGDDAHDEDIHRSEQQSDEADCDRASDQGGHEPDDELESEGNDGVNVDGATLSETAVEVDEDEATEGETWG